MTIPITTPALLFPAIAILMLGYVNRYIGTANVIRTFKKDYDSGYKHVEILEQLRALRLRIQLSRVMLALGSLSLMLACLSMFFIYMNEKSLGGSVFGLSIVGMILSLAVSLYETHLSNRSLLIEINDIVKKESKKARSQKN